MIEADFTGILLFIRYVRMFIIPSCVVFLITEMGRVAKVGSQNAFHFQLHRKITNTELLLLIFGKLSNMIWMHFFRLIFIFSSLKSYEMVNQEKWVETVISATYITGEEEKDSEIVSSWNLNFYLISSRTSCKVHAKRVIGDGETERER